MYNENTSNKSFLEMSKFLKMSGVTNCLFMLRQVDPNPLPDPYSKNLTDEDKKRIVAECKVNVWYFLREIVKVIHNEIGSPVSFKLNPSNMAMIYALEKGANVYNNSARQVSHKTVSMEAYLIWKKYDHIIDTGGIYCPLDRAKLLKFPDFEWFECGVRAAKGHIKWLDDVEFMDGKKLDLKEFTKEFNTSKFQYVFTSSVGPHDLLKEYRYGNANFILRLYDISLFPNNINLRFDADMLGLTEKVKNDFKNLIGQDNYDSEMMLIRKGDINE